MKKIVSILAYILLAILLVITAFTLCMKNDVLKFSVVNRLIDNSGIYETVYQTFEEEGREKAILVIEDNGLDPQLGEWMFRNINEVFSQKYIENLTRINVEAIVEYVLGESEELATFDLIPKYAQLMDVTSKNLDADVVAQVIGIENDNAIKALNIIDNIVLDDGIKKQVVESIFESTDGIKMPFMIQTTEQLLGFMGQEKQLENIYDARLKVQSFKRQVSGLLLFTVLLFVVIIGFKFKEIRKCLNELWITFALSGIVVLIAGLLMGYFDINVIKLINNNLSDIGFAIDQSAISDVIYVAAYGSMKIGLYYVIIAFLFLIASIVFKKKTKPISD